MKLKSSYVCQQCGYETPEWYGKCPSCGAWNTLVETVKDVGTRGAFRKDSGRARDVGVQPQKLSDVRHIEKNRLKSGFSEFDRVVGGGIVPGSVTLLAGDPGIGKSTLMLHVLSKTGGLYVTAEESAEQVKLRAKRLGIGGMNISILPETNVEAILGSMEREPAGSVRAAKHEPAFPLVIVDSVQAISTEELEGLPGSVGQIRRCAELLTGLAKGRGTPIVIIGHVTKEGSIAGPKVLEHMVDTVLYLEGERFVSARVLRTLKNRFGATEEVGIFDMRETGLKEVDNPSALFLSDRVKNVSGSVVTVILEGTRPILVEVQALVVPSQLPVPKRVANGFDYNRLQLLVAILQKRLNIPLGTFDIFVNVSGGLRISEPAADLAVALAMLSSFKNKAVDPKAAVIGELGLLGEVRMVGHEERRIKEAKRLGFSSVISPNSVRNLRQATKLVD
jgi:DNA repair protein RadA/Sms